MPISYSPILAIPHVSESQNDKEVPINGGIDLLEAALCDTLDVDVTSANQTVTDDNYRQHMRFRIIGATTAGRAVILGNNPIKRLVILRSSASNTQPVLIERGSTTITLYPGQTIFVYTNGTANGLDRMDVPGKVMPYSVAGNHLILSGDAGAYIFCTASTPSAMIIASNQDSPMDIGTRIWFMQKGTGQISLAAGTGVTILTARSLTSRAQYSEIRITKIDTDTWLASGDLT
ncbi:MAG TPA: hypothetical protein VM639_24630 [Dongiaceae bacterium]|nr:hypothetical protein [Dongiaceae bacterium]